MKENKEVKVYFDASSWQKEEKGNNKKGGVDEMKENKKELKELIREVENSKNLLVETVFKWVQSLCPVRDVHVKLKGRYYPFIEKESSKLFVIDKLKGAKVPFNALDQNMQFVICSTLAEKKEEIEKEVQKEKRKYLEGKLKEVNELLNKF